MKAVETMSREDLEEEVVWLRSELGLQQAADRASRLTQASDLTPAEAAITVALYGARGRPVIRLALEEAIDAAGVGLHRDGKHVTDVLVSRIRKKLGADVVATVTARGYRLSAEGLVKVAGLLGEVLA